MDLFVLDELLRRETVVDQYESLIWTERYSAYGDFELEIRSSRGARELLSYGKRLAIQESYRTMVIETVENGVSQEGIPTLKVSGRSLESILEDRPSLPSLADLTTQPTWEVTGTPAQVVTQLFDSVCRNGSVSSSDVLPFLFPGGLNPAGTIPTPQEVATFTIDAGNLYTAIKKICDMYNFGFRLLRGRDNSRLYFDTYTGDNRTTMQTLNPVVLFSPSLDNLSETTELLSVANYKNVAYVISKNGAATVYAENVDPTVSGFDRRALVVKADDIDLPAGPELVSALELRGREALAERRVIVAFDGEIPQNSSYVYGRHYNLGDIVEMRGEDGIASNMRVTEQIFVSDKTGVRSYPTLTIDQLITAGSWYAWNANQVWDDATEYWSNA